VGAKSGRERRSSDFLRCFATGKLAVNRRRRPSLAVNGTSTRNHLFRETWFEALLADLGFGPDEGPGGLVAVGDERVDLAMRSRTLVKEAPASDLAARIETRISIWLNQEARVGV